MNEVKRDEFDQLVRKVDRLGDDIALNTELTKDLHGLARSFKILATLAKWTGMLVAGILAIWHGLVEMKKLWH